MKIVMLSKRDYGGSGLRICQAVRRYFPEHEIVLITAKHARLGSDYCIIDVWQKMEQAAGNSKMVSIHDIIRNNRQMDVYKKRAIAHLQQLINEADIVHFKGDEPPVENWHLLEIPKDKKTIVSVGGSDFRRKALHPKAALARYPMQDYMRATLRTALTPDLNYPEYRGIYTQQAVDTDLLQPVTGKTNGRIIAHSPTHYGKKGTDLFLDALNGLNEQGYDLELDMLVHMDWLQCQYRKGMATWFFDQLGVGFYGNASLEAMAMGVPTVCHISRDALKQSDGKIGRHHPVFAMRTPTIAACQAALRRCIKADWQQASASTREFAVNFHGYKTVATMWDEIYRGL